MGLIKSIRVALHCNLEVDMFTKEGQISPRSREKISACEWLDFTKVEEIDRN